MSFQRLSVTAVLALSLCPLGGAQDTPGRLSFKLLQGYMITVSATARESVRLKVQIDSRIGLGQRS
ncbi:MAG: hypothetical protein ACE5JX_22960 [Acidobacteriota bacterium]